MKRQIKCIFGLLLIFAVMVMPAFAEGEENIKIVDANGNVKNESAKSSDGNYEDINDFFETASEEEQDNAINDLIPSLSEGVGALSKFKPVWNPAKFTTWFIVGAAVVVGIIAFAGNYTKASAGTLFDKVKWVLGGQKGMFLSGLLLIIFIVYLSVVKFLAQF